MRFLAAAVVEALIAYALSLLLDSLLIQGPREVTHFAATVRIDRPGYLDLVAYYSLVALVMFLHGILPWRRSSRSSPGRRCLRRLAALGVVAVILIAATSSLLVPRVSSMVELRGSVEAARYSYLLVRPVGSGKCWLQAPAPLMPNQDGRWVTEAHIGGIRGERFELILVSSEQALHPALFHSPGGYPCEDIPREAERFIREVRAR